MYTKYETGYSTLFISLFVERGFAMTGKQAQEKQFYCGV